MTQEKFQKPHSNIKTLKCPPAFVVGLPPYCGMFSANGRQQQTTRRHLGNGLVVTTGHFPPWKFTNDYCLSHVGRDLHVVRRLSSPWVGFSHRETLELMLPCDFDVCEEIGEFEMGVRARCECPFLKQTMDPCAQRGPQRSSCGLH